VAILSEIHAVWPEGADILHIHNPTLGKNSRFLEVIRVLGETDTPLLLQIHDFAEDGRPENYRQEARWLRNCHYAVINGRDRRLLLQAGLLPEGLHLLPNAVRPLPRPIPASNRDLVLYPVRAIRRKNLGEAVLLSRFLKTGLDLGITLESTGDLDRKSYDYWRSFVRSRGCRVGFGMGTNRNLVGLLGRTRLVVTTSIKEGFGFSFLEPWTASLGLRGRLLPDICADFIDRGLDLSCLYEALWVPVALFDFDLFRKRWMRCYRGRLAAYGMKPEEDADPDCLLQDNCVDFGMLDEDLQGQVIDRTMGGGREAQILLDRNPFLRNISDFEDENTIARNGLVVSEEYSVRRSGDRLERAYEGVQSRQVLHRIDTRVLLRYFNRPSRYHLLLCGG
jgi:hypothetical protein